MSQNENSGQTDSQLSTTTRVDSAHRPEPQLAQPVAENDGASADVTSDREPGEQMRLQAAQLANHLREKQHELDRRESELNAFAAHLERESRNSRLWLQERQREFSERQRQIEQHEMDVESRVTQLATAEIASTHDLRDETATLSQARAELERLQKQLGERERDLAARKATLDEREAAGSAHREASEQTLQRERLKIAEAQQMLDEHLAQLETDREQLNAERARFDEQTQNEADVISEARRRSEQELLEKRRHWELRAKKLEQREAVVQQLQEDVAGMHREAIEARLIAEQLWSQVTGKAKPADLTSSMSHIRRQLADHYRYEQSSLAQQKQDLESLLEALHHKQEDFRRQRSDLQEWVARRHEEIEEQAARLVAREQELDRQAQKYERLGQQWAQQRRDLQKQIRQLTQQPDRIPA